MKSFNTLLMALLLSFTQVPAGANPDPLEIPLDTQSSGRTFEGAGGVSAGASTRNLVDYPDKQRAEVLDYLFKPKVGANLQHLKVEVGGDHTSTCGSEPSHVMTREELKTPKARGYEFWLMSEARKRNPRIILDCLPWCYPAWIKGPFTQDSADWLVAFLDVARKQYGLELEWLSAGWNERTMRTPAMLKDNTQWIVKTLRPTLDAAGYAKVKLQGPDDGHGPNRDYKAFWDAIEKDRKLNSIVGAVGYHYLSRREEGNNRSAPPPGRREKATGKPIWASEEYSRCGKSWAQAFHLAKWLNRVYIRDRATKFEAWCPVNSIYPGIPYAGTGLMGADSPWSGHYEVWPAIWTMAHTTQFAEPGWIYMDSACGYLQHNDDSGKPEPAGKSGNYVALRNPQTGDWSVILCTTHPQTIRLRVDPNLKQAPVHVWCSTAKQQFVKLPEAQIKEGTLLLNMEANAVYSLTTTTGQAKGDHGAPPAAKPFPLPYREDFESYPTGVTPKYLSDQVGTFETVTFSDGRKCLQQITPKEGIVWYPYRTPFTLWGSKDWGNYTVQADVLIKGGNVEVGGHFIIKSPRMYQGTSLILDRAGQWSLINYMDISKKMKAHKLAQGSIPGFKSDEWHTLRVSFHESKVTGFIDGKVVFEGKGSGRTQGMPFLASSYDPNCFDNVEVTVTP